MIPEASVEQAEHGLVPKGGGWFVVKRARGALAGAAGAGLRCGFESEPALAQLGVSLYVLAPGEPVGMYHWEPDQEDVLVLDGAALLLVEGEERPLGRWDFVHCAAGTNHIIVGAGDRPCVVLAVGARETSDVDEAYARIAVPRPAHYRDGSLAGG